MNRRNVEDLQRIPSSVPQHLFSYDRVARFYDSDMGLSAPAGDVAFYVKAAMAARGEVLEVGCGTGRITLPLVEAGCQVLGVDVSLPMLKQMSQNAFTRLSPSQRTRLNSACMDMKHLGISERFSLILCPYSAFTYLVDEPDRSRFLSDVCRLLAAGGRFILDVFVPRQEILAEPDERLFFDYRREVSGGLVLERRKTIQKNLTSQVNCITRYYKLLEKDGAVVEEFSTRESIRYWFQPELRLLLEGHGLEVLAAYGDFDGQPYRCEAQMMVFVCQVRK
jgi:SAM-dependent methyltransferase